MNKKAIYAILFCIVLMVLAIGVPTYLQKQKETRINDERIMSRANEIKSANPELYSNLTKSVEENKNLIEKDPNDYGAWADMGVAQQALGDYIGAEKSYRQAIKINAVNTVSWNNLATMYIEGKDYKNAEKAYKSLLENMPGEVDAYLKLAELYASGNIGTVQDAARILEDGIRVTGGNQGLKDALSRLQLTGKL
jgi:Tfp pilus assembly protein PilF